MIFINSPVGITKLLLILKHHLYFIIKQKLHSIWQGLKTKKALCKTESLLYSEWDLNPHEL